MSSDDTHTLETAGGALDGRLPWTWDQITMWLGTVAFLIPGVLAPQFGLWSYERATWSVAMFTLIFLLVETSK